MIAAVFVCLFGVAEWKQIQENTDWGVLMLFGGGLSLSVILTQSGASKALVESVQFLISDSSYFVIGVVVATFIIFLTEFTSNTVQCSTFGAYLHFGSRKYGAQSVRAFTHHRFRSILCLYVARCDSA